MENDHLNDTRLTVLRLVAKQSGHTLALPETALHEYVSIRRAKLARRIVAATNAIRDLLAELDTWPSRSQWESLPKPSLEELTEEVERDLRRGFEILPLTEEILRQAVVRDIYRSVQENRAERASLVRDTAMWAIVESACAASGTTPVLFIGAAGEFGKRLLRPQLGGEMPDNLVLCPGIEHAVTELTGSSEADLLLQSSPSEHALTQRSSLDDFSSGHEVLVASSSLSVGDNWAESRPRPRIASEVG